MNESRDPQVLGCCYSGSSYEDDLDGGAWWSTTIVEVRTKEKLGKSKHHSARKA